MNQVPVPPRRSARTSVRVLRILRKVGVAVVGGIVVAIGLTLIVLPGPAIVVVPLGVAILATEFIWAQRLLLRIRSFTARVLERMKRTARPQLAPVIPEVSASPIQGPREP
jgi:uncharacterized protein (TIGR02611 family)